MAIASLFEHGPTLSFEFFPPATDEAHRQLEKVLAELSEVRPSFVSVTCGAGGSPQDRTREIVVDIARTHDFPAMAHLTCVGQTEGKVAALLADYAANDVHDILALAGDPPADGRDPGGDFHYASELVDLVRSLSEFDVAVAAHPEVHPRSQSRADDRRHLAEKLRRADFAITQFFFDAADYSTLIAELHELDVDKPVVPGVFPVTAPSVVRRFAAMNRTTIPEDLFGRLEAAEGAVRHELAVESAVELVHELLDRGAPGVHLYTMNKSETALEIVDRLSLR